MIKPTIKKKKMEARTIPAIFSPPIVFSVAPPSDVLAVSFVGWVVVDATKNDIIVSISKHSYCLSAVNHVA